MSTTFRLILQLVEKQDVKVSDHGYDQMTGNDISVRDVMAGARDARIVEDYPEYPKGPCVLTLQMDRDGRPIHVVWGIPKGADAPAVVVTA